jgi:ribosomal protein L16 Arg81 hydroxylase
MPIKAPQKGIQITDTLRKKYLSSPPAHQIVLQEGDVLYVPRGVVHDAFTEGEFSIHITFGFHPVLKIDFLKRLTSQLEMHSFFREPYFPLFNECDLEQSKKEIVEKVTKQLINVLDNPPAYDIYKSKYKDTQNMFTHLLLLDSLESIQDLEYIEITTNSNVEEELNEEESAFFNKVIDYQLHTDSSVFNDMSTEDFKKLFKDLIVKGFIKTINTQEIIPR